MGKRLTIALGVFATLLGSYTAGYFGLGKRTDVDEMATIQRSYQSTWLPSIFTPAAIAEHWLTGRNVQLIGRHEF